MDMMYIYITYYVCTYFCRAKMQLHLNGYHEWFTNLVADWLDAAAQKCNVELKRAVTGLDDVRS